MKIFKNKWVIQARQVLKTLVIQLVLPLLLLASAGTMAADELNEELLRDRIQTIQEGGSSKEIDTTLGIYQETLTWLHELEAQNLSAASYADALQSSQQREAEIRAGLDILDDDASFINSESLKDLSWSELEQQASDIRTQLTELHSTRDGLDRRIATEEANIQGVQTRLAEIDQRELELPNIIIVIDPQAQPSQFEASQWLMVAEQQSLDAERRALNARLASQPARFSRRRVEHEEATMKIAILQNDLASLEAVTAEQDQFNDTELLAQLKQDAPGYGMLQGIIDDNTELANQRIILLEKLNSGSKYRDELQSRLAKLIEQYDAAEQIVDFAGESSSFGRILMAYWHKADQFRPAKSVVNVGREVGDEVIRRAEHERQLLELASATAYVNRLQAGQSDSKVIEAATLEIAIEQTLVKRSRLHELIDLESQLVAVLGEIAVTLDKLDVLVEEYTDFLTSHVLWVPSHSPVGRDVLKQLVMDIRRTVGQAKSIPQLSFNLLTALGLVLAVVLIWLRKRWVNRRKIVNQKIGRPRSDSIKHTFLSLLLTTLQAAALPLFLVVLTSTLQGSLASIAMDLSDSLLVAAKILFFILFMRAACDEHGVARVHFSWAPANCDRIFELANWALYRLWPLLLLTNLLVSLEGDEINAVLGRLVYCAAVFVLGYKLVRVLRIDSGEKAVNELIQKAGAGIIFLLCAAPVVLVLAGYLLPAQMVFISLTDTLVVIIVLTMTYFVLTRWLLVTRRQLRFQQLVTSLADQEQAESEADMSYTADLGELSETAGELLKAGTMTLGAVWLLYVWTPLLPALQGFQRISLWSVSETVGGVQVTNDITLATLLLALLVGVVTLYAAQKLPALLELFLRSYSKLTPGTSYAAVTVLNYIIIGSGLVFLLSTLGLRWEKLQWLVAALSVGIGFGLQEIVANFISGLIILFERPIRVGDIVTVGESSGTVTKIRIRATTIRDWDRKELLVPNKEFVTARLLNWTLSDAVNRIVFTVGIAYGSDVEKAIRTLSDVVNAHEEVLKDPEPSIVFNEFASSSLNLSVRCFISGLEQRMRITSELHQRVDAAFREAGIVIAFPQRDVHLDTTAPLRVSIEKPDL